MELDEQIAWLENKLRDACNELSQSPIPETADYWRRVDAQIDEVLAS